MSWRDERTDRNERWEPDRGKPRRKSPFWDMRKYPPSPDSRRESNRDRFDRKDRQEFDRHREDDRRDDRENFRRNDRENRRDDRFQSRRDDRSSSRRDDRGDNRHYDRDSNRRDDHRRNEIDRDHYRRGNRSRERSQDRSRSRSTASKRRSPIDMTSVPNAPSPPRISRRSQSRSRSNSIDAQESITVTMDDTDTVTDFEPKLDDINMKYQSEMSPGDWMCKCGSYNFRRRQMCFRRGCDGHKSEGTLCGTETSEGKTGITKKILFRKLDALTTEEKVIEELKDRCSKSVLESIAGITIGRETLTGASKCLAYVTFNSIIDSTAAFAELTNLSPPLVIEGRHVLISYYQEPVKHAKATVDYAYYAPSFATGMSETDKVNAAAAVAQSAISAAQSRLNWTKPASSVPIVSPTGDGKTVYSSPDVSTFLYEESSGYYYDPATALYFDANTQYFYNSTTSQYLFWDAATNTYKKAVTTDTTATPQQQPEEKKKKETKEDKVKVAKKIAKDMERWAKTLNQKKENAKSNYVAEQPKDTGRSKGSADIGFSVLGAGPSLVIQEKVVREREVSPPIAPEEFLTKTTPQTVIDSDENVIDWAKLTCLLCKRKFPSAEVLTKHKLMSDLHKQNLADFQQKNSLNQSNNGYRDRAAERRMKFGEDEPILNKRYEPPEPLPPPLLFQPGPSVVDTIGGKMLQKMGWSQGKGLGKEEQGRTAPIEAEQRPGLAGLGQKRGIYTPTPGETYRDTVKKLMIARYKEVVSEEDGK